MHDSRVVWRVEKWAGMQQRENRKKTEMIHINQVVHTDQDNTAHFIQNTHFLNMLTLSGPALASTDKHWHPVF